MLKLLKKFTKEEAALFRKDRGDLLFSGKLCGCFDCQICNNCLSLIGEQGCMCCPYFICPECGFENNKEVLELAKNVANKNLDYFSDTLNISSSLQHICTGCDSCVGKDKFFISLNYQNWPAMPYIKNLDKDYQI